MTEERDEAVTPPPTPVNAPAERQVIRKPRVGSQYPLPSDRFAYPVHAEVLRKFNTLSSGGKVAVPTADIVGENIPQQAPALNVRFWENIGMLTLEDGKWKPTPPMVSYVVARAAGPERARPVLREIISKTWFADAAKMAFGGKSLMPREELEKDLAMVAKVPYDKRSGSFGILIDYLADAEIIKVGEEGVSAGSMEMVGELNATPGAIGVKEAYPNANSETKRLGGAITAEIVENPAGNWWTRSGTGFVLRIEPSPRTVALVKKHLDIIEEELKDSEAKSS